MKDRTTLPTINFELPGYLYDLLKQEINSIKHSEINTPQNRELKLENVKRKLLWQEVTISDFKIVNHRSETIQVSPSFQNPFQGQTVDVFIVTVEATTTGNSELFNYSPQAIRFSSNMDSNVYQPVNDKITIDIQSKMLDKKLIIEEANKKMIFTNYLIENNNQYITDFNRSFENRIEEHFNQKADEIEQLYS
ncbi:hypothetical protein GCM10023210_33220 [Chryseobacterium ginsengisoli]|uniref:Uncharacterized protein n=1 Tax=Chryseobacterium ginsengisoli TaxID=363853 RepID=A0ABP9MK03_9FLAO